MAAQDATPRHVVAGAVNRLGKPGVERPDRQRIARPGQLDHRARPVLGHRHREAARAPGLTQPLGDTGQQRHDLEPVAPQQERRALGHD